jgi:hypothetical protein
MLSLLQGKTNLCELETLARMMSIRNLRNHIGIVDGLIRICS